MGVALNLIKCSLDTEYISRLNTIKSWELQIKLDTKARRP